MRKTARPPKSGAAVDFLDVRPYKRGHVREAGPRRRPRPRRATSKNTLIKKGRTPR